MVATAGGVTLALAPLVAPSASSSGIVSSRPALRVRRLARRRRSRCRSSARSSASRGRRWSSPPSPPSASSLLHRQNIRRLLNGTEARFSRAAAGGRRRMTAVSELSRTGTLVASVRAHRRRRGVLWRSPSGRPASPAPRPGAAPRRPTTARRRSVPGHAVHAIYAFPSDRADRSAAGRATDGRRRGADRRLVAAGGSEPDPALRPLPVPLRRAARRDDPAAPAERRAAAPVEGRADRSWTHARRPTASPLQRVPRLLRRPDRCDPRRLRGLRPGRRRSRTAPASRSSTSALAWACRARRPPHTSSCTGWGPFPTAPLAPCPDGTARTPATRSRTSCTRSRRRSRSTRCVLDVGRDDYYGHAGAWPDVQDSAWLVFLNAQVRLTVGVTGRRRRAIGRPGDQTAARPCRPGLEWRDERHTDRSRPPRARSSWSGRAPAPAPAPCSLRARRQAANVGAVFAPATYGLACLVSGKGRFAARRGASPCRIPLCRGGLVRQRARSSPRRPRVGASSCGHARDGACRADDEGDGVRRSPGLADAALRRAARATFLRRRSRPQALFIRL